MDVFILSLLGLQLSTHGKHDYCNITLMYIVFRARVDDGVFSRPKPGHRLSHLSFKNTKTSPPPLPPGLEVEVTCVHVGESCHRNCQHH